MSPVETRKQPRRGRREVLRVLGMATVTMGTMAAMPARWTRPVVDTVILPAHASCTTPACFEVMLDMFDFDLTPPAGGNAGFLVELQTLAPQCEAVEVKASVDNGTLFGSLSETIYSGASLIVAWIGAGEPGLAVPLAPTTLKVERICANGEQHSDTFDLRQLAQKKSGAVASP